MSNLKKFLNKLHLILIDSKIKQVIKLEQLKRKRRIRLDRIFILIGGLLVCVGLMIGGFFVIKGLFAKDVIADEYAKASEENKLQDVKIKNSVYAEEMENGETFVYAIHTPDLGKDVNEKIEKFVEASKEEKGTVTHVDFTSNSAFDQYRSYVITLRKYAYMDGLEPVDVVATQHLYINYDQNQLIDLDHVVRGKVIDRISLENKIKPEELKLVSINEKGIVMDAKGKSIEYSYVDHPTSFVMENKNVPTLLKYPKIEVKKREIDPDRPMVAFTFDDGPAPGNTERILRALEKVKGRATFFELGSLMEEYPETVRAITKSGSEVANHSYDHPWLTEMSLEDAIANVQKTNDIFFSLTGNEINVVRPPYGAYNEAIENGLTEDIVLWDVDTRDWESRNTKSVVKMAKDYTYDGAIVLFHDIHDSTIPAVEELIEYYHSKGYQFVTVSELYEARGK